MGALHQRSQIAISLTARKKMSKRQYNLPGKALLIHGAFQDSSLLGGLPHVLRCNNICPLAIDLPLHGNQKYAPINKIHITPQTLAQQIINRPELVDSLNQDNRNRLIIIGYSLGALVSIELASMLQKKNTKILLVAIEPILRLDGSCQGQKDFLRELDNMRTICDPIQMPIIQYFDHLHQQDNRSNLGQATKSINKLIKNENIQIYIIKGGRNFSESADKKIELYENTPDALTVKCIGAELGTLIAKNHLEDVSGDIPIATIKDAGHNPMLWPNFYNLAHQLIRSHESG
jgi:pimeloyl-ACP methyl ester carboxylesterase